MGALIGSLHKQGADEEDNERDTNRKSELT